MPNYFVTGKLGSGKTLLSVSLIRDRLNKGLPVATNININLVLMLGRNKKNTRLFRVPDKPSIEDFDCIGYGNKSYDEEKNGLLVLDECGTWFNSRTWGDKSRQAIINWFLHARKLGWDVIFLVQDISIVDKQARNALAEHVVYCRRTDRVNIPFIGAFYKLITGGKLPLPKVHTGVVRYGDLPTSLKVDTWSTVGLGLYSCYDTKQQFSDIYSNGVYSVLPPYYTHGRYAVPKTLRNIMRITKIYFRKWSVVGAFFLGSIGSALVMAVVSEDPKIEEASRGQDKTINDEFGEYKIVGYANYPNQISSYNFVNSDGEKITSSELADRGYSVKDRGRCEALIIKGKDYVSLYCN